MIALLLATFSIVAADPASGQLGVAVQSKFPAAGAIVPAARAGVGAVATQAAANIGWQDEALKLLQQGLSAEAVVKKLVEDERAQPGGAEAVEHRQVGVVDAKGNAAAFTGKKCFDFAGQIVGKGYSVQGNILVGRPTLAAMAAAFEKAQGKPLAERMLLALEAGADAGGDRRGRESAALLVLRPGGGYGGVGDKWVDLRVDDAKEPIGELKRLYFDVHQYYFGITTNKVPIDAALSKEIQTDLARLGYLKTPVSASWDAAAQRALFDWQGWENLEGRELKTPEIDELVLKHLRRQAAQKR